MFGNVLSSNLKNIVLFLSVHSLSYPMTLASFLLRHFSSTNVLSPIYNIFTIPVIVIFVEIHFEILEIKNRKKKLYCKQNFYHWVIFCQCSMLPSLGD